VSVRFRVVLGVGQRALAYWEWRRHGPVRIGHGRVFLPRSVTLGEHFMQKEAPPGEVLDRVVLGLTAQPLLKSVQYAIIPSGAETADETTHTRVPLTHPTYEGEVQPCRSTRPMIPARQDYPALPSSGPAASYPRLPRIIRPKDMPDCSLPSDT
jgi:hypothetical protein